MSEHAAAVDHIVTVIPARDEAGTVEACVRSVLDARVALPPSVSASVVVVADSCADATVEFARAAVDPVSDAVVECALGSAGSARRVGTAHAIARAPAAASRLWICSTDADSTVPPDWLRVHLDVARRGYVAVAGIVRLDDRTEHHLRSAFVRNYAIHANGTHPHVHGTNLGFRADGYLLAGGWADLATGEDHDLWGRLCRVGPTLSSVELAVTTSGRTAGRAPDGFARDLATLDTSAGSAA